MAKYKQLCWNCAKACDKENCVWVKTLDKTLATIMGCEFDKDEYIIACKRYEKETKPAFEKKIKAKILGVSYATYQKLEKEIKQKKLDTTPEELWHKKEEQRERNKAIRESGMSYETWHRLETYIRKNNLTTTPEELYKQRKEERKRLQEQEKSTKKKLTAKYKAHLAGINLQYYYKLQKEIKQQKLDMTPEQLFELKNHKKKNEPTDKEKAEMLGIEYQYFVSLKRKIREENLNMSIEELLAERQAKKERAKARAHQTKEPKPKKTTLQDKAKLLGVKYSYYIYLQNKIKQKKLDITPEELYRQKQAQKQERKKVASEKKQAKERKPKIERKPRESNIEKAKLLGVTPAYYKDLKKRIRENKLDITPEELYRQVQERKRIRQEKKEHGRIANQS
ncbi:MAG: hypothetical protein IJ542_00630 [Clostridia bacterium]|nr:hypothetical protein [Clostridia bacterium]